MLRKIVRTYAIIKAHKTELKKELTDLTGITKLVVGEILVIWK